MPVCKYVFSKLYFTMPIGEAIFWMDIPHSSIYFHKSLLLPPLTLENSEQSTWLLKYWLHGRKVSQSNRESLAVSERLIAATISSSLSCFLFYSAMLVEWSDLKEKSAFCHLDCCPIALCYQQIKMVASGKSICVSLAGLQPGMLCLAIFHPANLLGNSTFSCYHLASWLALSDHLGSGYNVENKELLQYWFRKSFPSYGNGVQPQRPRSYLL